MSQPSSEVRNSVQRKKPRYDHSIWNHYQSILNDESITTNVSESWNSASKLSMPMKPSLWTLLDAFKREEAAARAKTLSISVNSYTDPNPGRTQMRKKKRERLKMVLEKFDRVPVDDYMNMIAAHYNDN